MQGVVSTVMDRLYVNIPGKLVSEERYVVDTIFSDFLGVEYELLSSESDGFVLSLSGNPVKSIRVENVFFSVLQNSWLKTEALPKLPLDRWNVKEDLPEVMLCEDSVPVIYGKKLTNGSYFQQTDRNITIGLDIFGSIFFMLTRYEECVNRQCDQHERYPATESIAFKEGFLMRPIVNEYVEILWTAMKRLWPGIERKKRNYRVIPTHDVDLPTMGYKRPWGLILKSALGDIVKRKSLKLSLRRLLAKAGAYKLDPGYSFDFIMDMSEEFGLTSEFYFMTDHSHPKYDTFYNFEDEHVTKILRAIHERGHIIGLHASYNSYSDPKRIKREFQKLISGMEKLGIRQDKVGSRQHFLRFRVPVTWRILDQAGVDYDTTLSFAQHVGFRAGTCYEYQVYDLEQRKPLKIRERPLIAMDGSLLDRKYMGLDFEKAAEYVQVLAKRVRMFSGDLVLLWHNTRLTTHEERQLYNIIIEMGLSV